MKLQESIMSSIVNVFSLVFYYPLYKNLIHSTSLSNFCDSEFGQNFL